MKFYDVTRPITPDLPVWPGDPSPEVLPVSSISAGDQFNVSALRLGTHTGTHVDAPRHLFPDGDGVDRLPLDVLVGDAWVCRLPPGLTMVAASDLEAAGMPEGTMRLLLASDGERAGGTWQRQAKRSKRRSRAALREGIALAPDAARWIVEHGIRLVGTESLSIDPEGAADPATHRTLLSRSIVVIEGLDLHAVPAGAYHLVCLPLRLPDADGSPARVLLVSHNPE